MMGGDSTGVTDPGHGRESHEAAPSAKTLNTIGKKSVTCLNEHQ